MPEQTVYSSEPLLASPRGFARAATDDLLVVPAAAWRIWRRGLQARLRRSRLGIAWLVVPSVAVALTWAYLQHAQVVRFGNVGVPYLVYVLAGMLLWQTFVDALLAPLRRLGEARPLLSKTRLPHETWLVAGLFDVLFGIAVRGVVIGVALVAAGARPGAQLALVPLGLLAIVVLGFAVGLSLVPVGMLYDDVSQALIVIVTLWFFLTPVVYPVAAGAAAQDVIRLNPVTPLLVTTRAWATDGPGATPGRAAIVFAGSLVLLVVSWLVYRLARPHLVARL